MISICADNSLWEFEIFQQFKSHITHFVTSRHGGFSTGEYATFNPSPYSGDDIHNVTRNLDKLENSLVQRPRFLFRPRQVHGIEMRVIDKRFFSFSTKRREKLLIGVDALTTRECGCCICISTADCVPILLYDKNHDAVAAVHAGWRGTMKRILYYTLLQMQSLYGTVGKDVYAGIGPSISLQAFEVGKEVYNAFSEANFDMNSISLFNNVTKKYHIDLWKANIMQLEAFGVPDKQIELSGICTYMQYEDFFSVRRLGKNSGRILSGIMIDL